MPIIENDIVRVFENISKYKVVIDVKRRGTYIASHELKPKTKKELFLLKNDEVIFDKELIKEIFDFSKEFKKENKENKENKEVKTDVETKTKEVKEETPETPVVNTTSKSEETKSETEVKEETPETFEDKMKKIDEIQAQASESIKGKVTVEDVKPTETKTKTENKKTTRTRTTRKGAK